MVGHNGRPHSVRRYRKPGRGSARSKTPHMHGRALRGNRESLYLPRQVVGRTGKSKGTR